MEIDIYWLSIIVITFIKLYSCHGNEIMTQAVSSQCRNRKVNIEVYYYSLFYILLPSSTPDFHRAPISINVNSRKA